MFVVDAGSEHFLDVVHIVPAVGGISVCHGCDILAGEERLVLLRRHDGSVRHLVHHLGHVVIVGELGTVHEFGEIGIHGNTHRTVVADVDISLITLLGSDDNDTAGSLQAVHGGGGAVLENGYALNVGRVDIVDIAHREAVHHVGNAIDGAADAQ